MQLLGLGGRVGAELLGQVITTGLEGTQCAADVAERAVGPHHEPVGGLRGPVDAQGGRGELE